MPTSACAPCWRRRGGWTSGWGEACATRHPRDPHDAFIYLERKARNRYRDAVDSSRVGPETYQCEFDYMSAVLAVAKVHGIAELTNWQLPLQSEERWWEECRTVRAEAEHVAYKLLLHQHRQRDTYSVALDAATKSKLQHSVQQGRDLIAKVDLTVPKRERLLACLNAFQVELDRERTHLQVIGALTCEAAAYASEAAGKLDGFIRMMERISVALGVLRQAEDERERGKRLPLRLSASGSRRPGGSLRSTRRSTTRFRSS